MLLGDAKHDHPEALAAYELAKETLKRLASESPKVPKYRLLEATADMRIGNFHLASRQDKKALAAFQSAKSILMPMAAESAAYQPYLDEAKAGISEVEQYIKEAASVLPPTPSESPATAPNEPN